MSLLNLITAIVAGCLLLTSPAWSEDGALKAALTRRGRSCIVNHRVYRHGQIFTIGRSRCIKYRCYDGSYDFHEEGCDAWGSCRAINQYFEHDCWTYLCSARHVGGGYRRYQVRPVSTQQCKDYSGRCRRPGEEFPYVMKGQLKRRCRCEINGMSIRYYCYN
ncbi:uncharacterized protein LOC143285682 [Babylonia areolata]|uniref:uncharacterized protein LOC143285682 n=1 Tax=Babylonia areolata TaxID=304850 RepID=UPI003FD1EC15